MTTYTATYEYITPAEPTAPPPVIEFEAIGAARANAVAARYARDNVFELVEVAEAA